MKSPRLLALTLLVLLFAGAPALAIAQGNGESSAITSSLSTLHKITTTNIMKTAEMLSDDLYAYRPTGDVRTAGEMLAHIANAQYLFCSAAAGVENPSQVNFEETATSKADIITALRGAFEYCDGVYSGMNDVSGAEMRSLFGRMELAASAVMAFNSAHNYEHYGNLVTYMRMNGIVPPSSM